MKQLISWALVVAGLFVPVMAAPCSGESQHAFDFWLGNWVLENRQRLPSQPERGLVATGSLRSDIRSLAGGCVIFEQTSGQLVYGAVEGVSLRARDTQEKHWTILNFWAVAGPPTFSRWQGRVEKDRIRSIAEAGGQPRYVFRNISPQGWEWVQHKADPDGDARTSWLITAKPAATSASLESLFDVTDTESPVNCIEQKWRMPSSLPIAFAITSANTERVLLPGVCALLERRRISATDRARQDRYGGYIGLIGFDFARSEWRRFSYDSMNGRLLETTPAVDTSNMRDEGNAHEYF